LLENHNVAIARGGGEWSDAALRMGHMGLGTQPDHIIALLLGLEQTLRSLGRPVERGSSLAGLSALWADEFIEIDRNLPSTACLLRCRYHTPT
jgi:aspartate aminotransferase-like enzyme